MFKLFKFVFVLVVAGMLFFLTPMGQRFKNHIISIVNPAVIERGAVADLKQSLSTLSKTVNKPEFQKMSPAQQLSKINDLIKHTTVLANIAEDTAAKSDLTAGISTIIQKFIPPNQSSQASVSASSSVCPTP